MANDNDVERRLLNPRTMQVLRGTNHPRTNRPTGTNHPRTNRPTGTNHPRTNRPTGTHHPPTNRPGNQPGEIDQPSEEIGTEEDEGNAQSVLFTERLKSGYSTIRNEQLVRWWQDRQKLG